VARRRIGSKSSEAYRFCCNRPLPKIVWG
jgi:hypothetical protein